MTTIALSIPGHRYVPPRGLNAGRFATPLNSMANYVEVRAARGKAVRAEPISALYEQDKVRHVGRFPQLEDQMENFSTAGYMGDKSPDRADATVWALTNLMVDDNDFNSI